MALFNLQEVMKIAEEAARLGAERALQSVMQGQTTIRNDHNTNDSFGYSDAISAIMDSDMLFNAKPVAIRIMKAGCDSEVYKAVAAIAKNRGLTSNTRLEMITSLFVK